MFIKLYLLKQVVSWILPLGWSLLSSNEDGSGLLVKIVMYHACNAIHIQ
jgi:hypothetical protein